MVDAVRCLECGRRAGRCSAPRSSTCSTSRARSAAARPSWNAAARDRCRAAVHGAARPRRARAGKGLSTDLSVRLQPRARRDEIVGERDGAVLIRVTAPPVDGKANDALCRLVAKAAGIAPSRVSIVHGHTARDKVLRRGGRRTGRPPRRARPVSAVSASFRPAVVRALREGNRRSATEQPQSRGSPRSSRRGRGLAALLLRGAAAATRSRRGSRTPPSSSRATSCRSPACRPARSRTSSSRRRPGRAHAEHRRQVRAAAPRHAATVRQASLSGVANRYIDLRLPARRAPEIPDGGAIAQDATTTAVDLDEIFNTLDEPDPQGPAAGDQGLRRASTRARARQMNDGLLYLNPSLSASSRLFRELNADSKLLERFVVSSSKLVTDLADRREDLAGLVDNLATTTTAIGAEQAALADSDRAAARLHAPRQHDLPEPARDARRPRAAGRRLQAGRQEAAPVPRRAAPARPRRAADLPRPQPSCSSARRRQRPDRAHQRLRSPLRDVAVATSRRTARSARARSRPRPRRSSEVRRSSAYLRPYTRRPARLVRRLQPLRHLRRARRRLARRHPRERVRAARRPAHARAAGAARRRPSRPPRRPTSATAARAAASTSPRTARGPWKPTPDFNCDPSQVLPGK